MVQEGQEKWRHLCSTERNHGRWSVREWAHGRAPERQGAKKYDYFPCTAL